MAGAKRYNVRSVFFMLELNHCQTRRLFQKIVGFLLNLPRVIMLLYIPQLLNLIDTYPALENRLTLVSKKATGKDYRSTAKES